MQDPHGGGDERSAMQTELGVWAITEQALDLERLGWSETIFALSNGNLGLRGNLDEGEPYGELGTYLSGVHELRPMPHAEAGYGYPESGQTVINVTSGKIIRLLVDDEPFDVRYGTLLAHTRTLDMRAGTLVRNVEWRSPAGQRVRIKSTRMVSLTQRGVAAIEYIVEPVDESARLVLQSELVVNEPSHGPRVSDPRVAAALIAPLTAEDHLALDASVVLVHRTRVSGLKVAAGMNHIVDCSAPWDSSTEALDDLGRFTVGTTLNAGQCLRIVKFLAYGWSSLRSNHALRDQVGAALHAAQSTGWDELLQEQRSFLDNYWECNTVEIPDDPDLEIAIRFGMFHALQAGARTEGIAIPAKGLTGTGYDGHAFWDTEMFVLPFLNSAYPTASREVLRWRHTTLDVARQRAQELGLTGAALPWRTIDGAECSGYWPAGTAAFHVNAAVAEAVMQYLDATDDTDFFAECGAELVIEAARLFQSLGHRARDGAFHIDGVTGPDEYSAIADDNVYTNLMAQRTLRAAIRACAQAPDVASALGVHENEQQGWAAAADTMHIPYSEALGIHAQSTNFTMHPFWDFAATSESQYPLLQSAPYFDLYRKQVVKQADIVLAMHTCPEAFTLEEKRSNFTYYEAITVRDSSLSAVSQGIIAAELGHLELAEDYLNECAFIDLRDTHSNSDDGIHLAASVGAWAVVVAGFGGLRIVGGVLRFAPRIAPEFGPLSFTMRHLDRRISIRVTPTKATYELTAGFPLNIVHYGEEFTLLPDLAVTMAIPHADPPPAVSQPIRRAPLSRRLRNNDRRRTIEDHAAQKKLDY